MQRRPFIPSTFFLVLFTVSSLGGVIHVPGDRPTIQMGICAAVDGDTVLVAPGRYFENIRFRGKNIVVASHYILTSDPNFIQNTIIDGSSPAHSDTASCVLIVSGEDSTASLEGFTLTGGTGTVWFDSLTGYGYREGGGVLIGFSSPMVRDNLIIGNEAVDNSDVASAGGGGVCCEYGNPLIVGNVIKSNRGRYGAGMAVNYSSGVVKDNLVVGNHGGQDFGGGGIWVYRSENIFIENNTIVGNVSLDEEGNSAYGAGKGGGILMWDGLIHITNCIVWGNSQDTDGPLYLQGNPYLHASYSDIEGGFTGCKGDYGHNFGQDPLFTDTTYVLSDGSPCIDAGHPHESYFDPVDPLNSGFAAFPSKGDLTNDMGAYGGPVRRNLADVVVTPVLQDGDVRVMTGYSLGQNYPNPFNPATSIAYSIPRKVFVSLKVFNLFGQELETLVSEEQMPGSYRLVFTGESLPNGVYFYRLRADEYTATRKFIIVK